MSWVNKFMYFFSDGCCEGRIQDSNEIQNNVRNFCGLKKNNN